MSPTTLSQSARSIARHVPGATVLHDRAVTWMARRRFTSSAAYWDARYLGGGTSGEGSYGARAEFKADVINRFVAEHEIGSVIELGVGDGNQLALASYPAYVGFDVSPEAVRLNRARFVDDPSKRFELLDDYADERADLTLSLDVIFHLVEDEVFDAHMRLLFSAAARHVIIYSSNHDGRATAPHVRHREFTRWVADNEPTWHLERRIENPFRRSPGDDQAFADFHFFSKADD